jgi:hypothetical protein
MCDTFLTPLLECHILFELPSIKIFNSRVKKVKYDQSTNSFQEIQGIIFFKRFQNAHQLKFSNTD